jgi:hypothetical protein
LKLKEKENEQATHIEKTQRLVTEIEMLKVVLYLVSRKQQQKEEEEYPVLRIVKFFFIWLCKIVI